MTSGGRSLDGLEMFAALYWGLCFVIGMVIMIGGRERKKHE